MWHSKLNSFDTAHHIHFTVLNKTDWIEKVVVMYLHTWAVRGSSVQDISSSERRFRRWWRASVRVSSLRLQFELLCSRTPVPPWLYTRPSNSCPIPLKNELTCTLKPLQAIKWILCLPYSCVIWLFIKPNSWAFFTTGQGYWKRDEKIILCHDPNKKHLTSQCWRH